MNLLCRLGLHDWFQEFKDYRMDDDGRRYSGLQRLECWRCGIAQTDWIPFAHCDKLSVSEAIDYIIPQLDRIEVLLRGIRPVDAGEEAP